MADMEKATAVGELIARFVEKQTALEQHFLLHMHGDTGELVTELPDDLALSYRLDRRKPQRLFFMLGYLVFFFFFFLVCFVLPVAGVSQTWSIYLVWHTFQNFRERNVRNTFLPKCAQ